MDNESGKYDNAGLGTLESILLTSPIVVFRCLYTDGWPIVYISENIDNFGYNARHLIRDTVPLKDLVSMDNWLHVENALAGSSKASVQYTDSAYLTDGGGVNHIVEMHLNLIKDPAGLKTYVQGTVHMVEVGQNSNPFPVDGKEADLYEHLVSFVELLPIPALIVRNHHYHSNSRVFDLTGYGSDEINTIDDFLYTLNPEKAEEMEGLYRNNHFHTENNWQIKLKNGQSRWIALHIYTVSSMELWIFVEATDPQQLKIHDVFKQQEELLLALIDTLPLMITIYDKANHITFVNNTFAKETGYGSNYVRTHKIFELLFPDPDYRANVHGHMHADISEWREVKLKTRDGKTLACSWNNFSISENLRVGVGMNTTLIIDLENTLNNYRRQLQTIANQMEDVVFTIDTNRQYTSIFGTWLSKAGFTQEDFIGKTASEIFGDVGARIHKQHHAKALHGVASTYEFPVFNNGKEFWMQSSVSPLRDQKGLIIGAIGISHDITAVKKANERLILQDHALQVSANAIVIADEEGKIFWTNEALSTLTGYELPEVIGNHTRMFKSGKQSDTFYKNLWETVTHGKVWKGELVNRKKDGSLYVEEQTITPFIGSNGKAFYIAVKQDITSRVEREKNLHKAYKEKQTLLEEVHHRVKNNLALVSGFLELQMTTSSGHDLEILRRSQQRIHTMALIHENLYRQDNMSEVVIPDYIKRLLNDTDKAYRIPGRTIEIQLECDKISMNINQAVPFALICNEMVTNAYVHAFKDNRSGVISVSITAKNRQIDLKVKDDGVGIQEDKTSETYSSLGLTIMEQLAHQLNGKLTIKSNNGTTARLIFKLENVKGSHSYNLL